MHDRETILPLTVGLLVALALHLLAAVGYGRFGSGEAALLIEPGGPGPDLVALELQLPDELQGDQPIPIAATFANAGQAHAGAFEVLIEIDDQPVARAKLADGMPVGETFERRFGDIIAAPGAHTVRLTVDANSQVVESNERNNVIEVQRIWQAPRQPGAPVDARPDLSPFAIHHAAPAAAGRPVTLNVGVANLGAGPAESFALIAVNEEKLIGRVLVSPLPAATAGSIPLTVQFDEPGEYLVCVIADPADAIDETDETNNRFCQPIVVERARELVGDPNSNAVSINSISFEAFEQLRAQEQRWFEQPTAQTLVDATDVDRTPLDPTQAAANLTRMDGAAPSNPTPPTPPVPAQPPAAATASVEPQPDPAADAPARATTEAELDADAPVLADRPAVAAAAASDDEPTPPVERRPAATDDATPAELLDTTPTDDPTNAPPVVADPAEVMDLSNPSQPVDDGPFSELAADLPSVERSDQPVRRTPQADPSTDSNPTDAARPIDGAAGEDPTPAALPLPASEADAGSPQEEPRDAADSDTTGAPNAKEEPRDDEGEAATPDTAAESASEPDQAPDVEPMELAMAATTTPRLTPRQPAPPLPPTPPTPESTPSPTQPASESNPTEAPRSDFELAPVSTVEFAEVTPGQVTAVRGIRIKTVRPRPSVVARYMSLPGNPVVRIRFDGEGKVLEVDFVRSSGYANIDSPLRLAIYQWTAEGDFAEDGFVIERFALILNGKKTNDSRTDDESDE